MRNFHRRGGTVHRLMAWTLLSAPVALAATACSPASGTPRLPGAPHRSSSSCRDGKEQCRRERRSSARRRRRPSCRWSSRCSRGIPKGWRPRRRRFRTRRRPEYHHFLSPRQFAQRYGATSATIRQVTQDLDAQGLTVGPAFDDGPLAAGLGHGGACAERLLDDDRPLSARPLGRQAFTTDPFPRSPRPLRPRSKVSSASTPSVRPNRRRALPRQPRLGQRTARPPPPRLRRWRRGSRPRSRGRARRTSTR